MRGTSQKRSHSGPPPQWPLLRPTIRYPIRCRTVGESNKSSTSRLSASAFAQLVLTIRDSRNCPPPNLSLAAFFSQTSSKTDYWPEAPCRLRNSRLYLGQTLLLGSFLRGARLRATNWIFSFARAFFDSSKNFLSKPLAWSHVRSRTRHSPSASGNSTQQ